MGKKKFLGFLFIFIVLLVAISFATNYSEVKSNRYVVVIEFVKATPQGTVIDSLTYSNLSIERYVLKDGNVIASTPESYSLWDKMTPNERTAIKTILSNVYARIP